MKKGDAAPRPAHVLALEESIEIAGGQAALAAGIAEFMDRPTISQQTVSKWLRDETLIEAKYWAAFEHVTKRKVTRSKLRPDVFGERAA